MKKQNDKLRIGIDARFYSPRTGGGLGRYVENLIRELEKQDTENQYFIFLKKENMDKFDPANPNFHKVECNIHWYSLKESVVFPRIIEKYNLDLMHFTNFNVPYFYRGKFVVTIHDLILPKYSRLRSIWHLPFYMLKILAYNTIINEALTYSDKVIAVSDATKNELLKTYKIKPEKITVIREGCDLSNAAAEIDFINSMPFILYVGSAYPHKNLKNAILAFNGLRMKKKFTDWHFVLIGKEDFFYRRLKKWAANFSNIVFYGFADESALLNFYKQSSACIFPSVEEGLGLPILEAAYLNKKFVCSDIEAFREILGNYPYFFDPHNPEEIKNTLKTAIESDAFKVNPDIFNKYSWRKTAEETLEVYKKTCGL